MEGSVSPPVHKQSIRTPRKGAHQSKDIWLVVREGSVSDVDSALSMLKKNGGNINETGLTPLHIATWRNHIPIVQRFLVAGAGPNAVKDTVPNAEAQGFNPGLIVLLLVGVLVLVFFIGNYVMYMYAQ